VSGTRPARRATRVHVALAVARDLRRTARALRPLPAWWRDAPTRRARLVVTLRRLVWHWDDALPDDVPDCLFAPSWGVLERLCSLLRAHAAENDHCGRPEHRECGWCGRPMPDAPLTARWRP